MQQIEKHRRPLFLVKQPRPRTLLITILPPLRSEKNLVNIRVTAGGDHWRQVVVIGGIEKTHRVFELHHPLLSLADDFHVHREKTIALILVKVLNLTHLDGPSRCLQIRNPDS